ncbi:matrixin family metalloprotease [Foetidibacter luteolus]|uniref:matrixin family metalloprotease n=1 Tax=Foetidibacter luteolus TaxID=2608880 RepID=UPI00129AE008|nr:matrixin family metalloprotease [Foetidibacter luteolus]
MKKLYTFLATVTFLSSCQKHASISLAKENTRQVIAIQPLEYYDPAELAFLQKRLSSTFKIRVSILSPVTIPSTFINRWVDACSADSLLQYLKTFAKDSIAEVIGLTHKDLYVTREMKADSSGKQVSFTTTRSIFGLGYINGNTCIISDYKLTTPDTALLHNRLIKVTLHELGHNLGLGHCPETGCLMSETNGNMAMLNKAGSNYCNRCRKKLR